MGEEGEKKHNGLWVKTVNFDLIYGAKKDNFLIWFHFIEA